jgi:hypothetical protein
LLSSVICWLYFEKIFKKLIKLNSSNLWKNNWFLY